MALLNPKFVDNIPAQKVIETPDKRFVTDLHLEILNNSTLPQVTIEQYDDSQIKTFMEAVNSDMINLESHVGILRGAYAHILETILALEIKYDLKSVIPFNTSGYSFVDSLANNGNIASFLNCSYNSSTDSIK